MTSEEVVNQINSYIHKYTNNLSSSNSFTSSVSSNVMTVNLGLNDGFKDGQAISIQNCPVLIPISDVSVNPDGSYLIETSVDHDLTRDPLISKENVSIRGCSNPLVNGNHNLVDVLNRREFIISLEDSSGTVGSQGYLEQENGINGFYKITNLTSNSFDVILPRSVGSTTASGDIYYSFRVTGVADLARFNQAYTKNLKDSFWLVVVMNGMDISRDRSVQNDSVLDDFKTGVYASSVTAIERLSIFAYIPTQFEKAGRASSDEIEQLRIALFKSIAGYNPKKVFSSEYSGNISPVGDSRFAYLTDTTTYIHQFNFEVVSNLSMCVGGDFFVQSDDVAFRDIDMSLFVDNQLSSLESYINLDKEPL